MLSRLDPTFFPILNLKRLEGIFNLSVEEIVDLAQSVEKYYKPFDILEPKPGGTIKRRHIDNPVGKLKFVQQRINSVILRKVTPSLPNGVLGGVAGKSIIDNALPHTKKEVVVKVDLVDCFPNTDHLKIHRVWSEFLGSGRGPSSILTKLTTIQYCLPQGSPASLMLCNLALLPH